jgi:DNA-binding transcriptional ArsR family regulator
MPAKRRRRAAQAPVRVLDEPDMLQVLGHPLRVQILDALREPASAAAVARLVGQPRQNVNYHIRELEQAGLVRTTGERRSGNFVETLHQSVARSFIVAPQVAWADPRRMEALVEQHALHQLVLLGGRLQRDAAALLDRAAFDGEQIPSASIEAEVHFAGEEERSAFMRDYLKMLRELLDRYGAREGAPYRAIIAAYPADEANQ